MRNSALEITHRRQLWTTKPCKVVCSKCKLHSGMRRVHAQHATKLVSVLTSSVFNPQLSMQLGASLIAMDAGCAVVDGFIVDGKGDPLV